MRKQTDITEKPAVHEFVRTVPVSRISDAGLTIDVTANAGELPKIAAYLDLLALQSLTAQISLTRWRGKGVRVTGHFKADVTQECVVTLDPVEAHVEGEFERRFLPEVRQGGTREVNVDPEGEDPAEPLEREIDLGEIMVEELSLGLDPYPRKSGVAFAGEQDMVVREHNPFSVLAKLKGKETKKKGKS